MSKYRISVSIDGENYFWIVIDRHRLIKNPTKDDLIGTKLISYNKTNICHRCREENNIPYESILYPGNACHERDKETGEWRETGEWVCFRHHGSRWGLMKPLTDRRTGNLKDPYLIFADNCEELTCKVFDNLNKKNDNYKSPIDHPRHPVLGIIQTKGAHFSRDIGTKGGWKTGYRITEYEKEYDNMILWCVNDSGDIIEREYIISKKEINKRQTITIVKDPIKGIQWYEKYRVTDEDMLRKVNEIWKKIVDGRTNNI